jgi:DNA repair exonuclease SbcCD ATPase subunit
MDENMQHVLSDLDEILEQLEGLDERLSALEMDFSELEGDLEAVEAEDADEAVLEDEFMELNALFSESDASVVVPLDFHLQWVKTLHENVARAVAMRVSHD